MNSVLVRKIKHLTDARYFAAMGVDWMSMELNDDPLSFSMWHTVRDWVEGVRLAAEVSTADEMLMAKTIIEAIPDGIILNLIDPVDLPPDIKRIYETETLNADNLSPGDAYIIPYNTDLFPTGKLLQMPPDQVFLQTSWTKENLEALLATGYTGGVCFLGGEEDKTGVRDYAAMDELLGLLIQ